MKFDLIIHRVILDNNFYRGYDLLIAHILEHNKLYYVD